MAAVPFGPIDPQLDLVALETRVLARWDEDAIAAAVAAHRRGGTPWIFYEGPPTANGRPGLHHVWARVFKDVYPRFQTMRGHDVPRKGGWDCHGLPVEIEVEKELDLRSKHDVEAFGVAEFNRRCRASVQRYVGDWAALTRRAGVWIDTEDAYWTLSNDYIESVWWLVRQMWDRDLLYEGHRVVPYCPRCGTALSSHEVAQGYEDVVDPSVYVRFPVRPGHERDQVDLLVWTTTPWTLVSNVACAVGPDLRYVRVRGAAPGHDLVLAEDAASRLFHLGDDGGDDGEGPRIVDRYVGEELAGWRYERPFADLPLDGDAARVVTAGFVTTDDGSGIVHLAPAFGEDDAEVARAEGLPTLNPVDGNGRFEASVPWLAGTFVKEADPRIVDELRRRSLLVAEVPYEHAYPHCWRCGTPLLYWAKTSWFARTSERRAELLRENEQIGWHPAHLKHGRFGKWLESNVDWALSRDRFWGTPLPIWRCDDGHDTCVGSVAELASLAGRDLDDLDLHRPHVDEVEIRCPTCAGPARRLPPVLDAWFDSGAMPSAQQHYPFSDHDRFERAFPADFICEAIDQTRGWFYSLLAVNTLVFDATPYRNVVCLGHIVDEQGQKMSKSRGNVVDPWEIFDRFGADALRWYFFSSGQPWTPRRVSEDGIREATRKTLLTLWNVFSFFATYADLDGWSPEQTRAAPSHHLDRWILSELDDMVAVATQALDGFDALTATTRLATFVDDLSNWYVRRSRPRFWRAADRTAHATLHECLVTTALVLAPFCPFLADEVYVVLTGGASVHLADWPSPAGRWDPRLSARMDGVRRLVALGRAARTDARTRVRQPLRRALLLHPGIALDDDARAEIADELNVRALEDIDTLSGLVTLSVVPNFRSLGPRLGPRVNEVKQALAELDGGAVQRTLDTTGTLEVAGITLGADDVEVRAERHQDFALAQDGPWAVALDLDIDEGLRVEGTARELVRALNELRKGLGLQLTDRILLEIQGSERLAAAIDQHGSWIADEVLAVSLTTDATGPLDHELDLDGDPARARLQVAATPNG